MTSQMGDCRTYWLSEWPKWVLDLLFMPRSNSMFPAYQIRYGKMQTKTILTSKVATFTRLNEKTYGCKWLKQMICTCLLFDQLYNVWLCFEYLPSLPACQNWLSIKCCVSLKGETSAISGETNQSSRCLSSLDIFQLWVDKINLLAATWRWSVRL